MSYYKFTTKEALAAWDDLQAKNEALLKAGKSFAELFGAKPVFSHDLTRSSFRGIRFEGEYYSSRELWRTPTAANGYSCQPKAKAPRGMSTEHRALTELWDGQVPKEAVDRSAFYPSVGLDWGTLFLTGVGMFRRGDAIYIETGATPKDGFGAVEILGSEFKAARKEAE